MRLKDKIAIVTGGARGIGRAVCELFAREGAVVILLDLLPQGQEVADRINETGGTAAFHAVSVTDKSAIADLFAGVHQKYGQIDILINNAGIVRDAQLVKSVDGEVVDGDQLVEPGDAAALADKPTVFWFWAPT